MASHLTLIISEGIGPSGIPANLPRKGVLPDVGQIVLNLSWSLVNSRAKDLVAAECGRGRQEIGRAENNGRKCYWNDITHHCGLPSKCAEGGDCFPRWLLH